MMVQGAITIMSKIILYKECDKLTLTQLSNIPNIPPTKPDSITKTTSVTTTDNIDIGIWECSPGTFKRQVMEREFSHFIYGKGTFTTEDGNVLEFSGGDAIYFPENTHGTWEIIEPLRKSFIIIPQ